MTKYLILGGLTAVLFGGIALYVMQSARAGTESSEAVVRVNALRKDDGDVLVAVQQRAEDGSWGERVRPQFNRLPAVAERGQWFASSAVVLQGPADDTSRTGAFYTNDAIPNRELSLDAYLLRCGDASSFLPALESFIARAARGDATWGQFFILVDEAVTDLQVIAPPEPLAGYHRALTRLGISTAQYAALQPAAAQFDPDGLAAPSSIDGAALADAEAALDDDLAARMRDAGCIE